ncbi:MAG: hypothetical protein ACK5O9_06350 [Holosporales bacterium]|jgi:hypothetical protein
MSNNKSTPTSSSVSSSTLANPADNPWGIFDEPSEPSPQTLVRGAEKWSEVFGDQELKFKPDELPPLTEEQLKNMEEAAKLYYEVKTKMLSEGRNP